MTLNEIQSAQKLWSDRNFPGQPAHHPHLGTTEEIGELVESLLLSSLAVTAAGRLSHALLKREQGIRGTIEQHTAAEIDAIGDILIYLLAFCNHRGYSMQQVLEDTWGQVSQRDWQKNKQDGVTG